MEREYSKCHIYAHKSISAHSLQKNPMIASSIFNSTRTFLGVEGLKNPQIHFFKLKLQKWWYLGGLNAFFFSIFNSHFTKITSLSLANQLY
jgi:hypothetical protein